MQNWATHHKMGWKKMLMTSKDILRLEWPVHIMWLKKFKNAQLVKTKQQNKNPLMAYGVSQVSTLQFTHGELSKTSFKESNIITGHFINKDYCIWGIGISVSRREQVSRRIDKIKFLIFV